MSNINQLLFAEAVLKCAGGFILVLMPGLAIRFLGLPKAATNFWPRMLGAVLLGLAIATLIEGSLRASTGLGLAGSIAINLSTVAVLGSMLILGSVTSTKRGRIVLWCLIIMLTVLSLAELAFAT